MYLAWKEYFDSHEIENVLKNSFTKERTALETKGKIKEKRCVYWGKQNYVNIEPFSHA